jgi:hypothetical protein
MALTPAVADAIEELRATFPDATVTVKEDGEEGAYVVVDPLPTGNAFVQPTTWIGFHITFPYPEADVYPHFVSPELARVDGANHGEGFALTQWGPDAQPAWQLSRKSNRLNPAVDTAALKLLKVLAWLSKQ